MIWDKFAKVYDWVETLYNGKVYRQLGRRVSTYVDEDDLVLECACGTGVITVEIAEKCKKLFATAFSINMLSQAKKKCKALSNIDFEQMDITRLSYDDNSFDKVIAANVIHLLDHPEKALEEMLRVCKVGGEAYNTYIYQQEK